MKKEIKFTKQEKKNHKDFAVSAILFLIGAFCMAGENTIVWTIGWLLMSLSWFKVAHTGYSHGWELKRISLRQR